MDETPQPVREPLQLNSRWLLTGAIVVVLILAVVLSRCGKTSVDRAASIKMLTDIGFSEAEAECIVDSSVQELGDAATETTLTPEENAIVAEIARSCVEQFGDPPATTAATPESASTPDATATSTEPLPAVTPGPDSSTSIPGTQAPTSSVGSPPPSAGSPAPSG